MDFLELPLQLDFKRLKGNSVKDAARDGNWKENWKGYLRNDFSSRISSELNSTRGRRSQK